MVNESRNEHGVKKSCQIVLMGSLALANKGLLAKTLPASIERNLPACVELPRMIANSDSVESKPRANSKKHLASAKAAKRDEFYTLYKDIERELELYYKFNENVFRDKVVLLPCDDPRKSNFNKYFLDNFKRFGIRQLICTCYNPHGRGMVFKYEASENDKEILRFEDVQCRELNGNGDFRSDEIKQFRDQADVIVTNPPFSLFRQFFTWIMEARKKFLVIGNVNCISYKEVYPHIMADEVWLGHGIGRWISGFIVPEDYELYGTETHIDEEGNRIVSSNGCLWLTNIDHGRRHQPLQLMTEAENVLRSRHRDVRSVGYRKYDNCDAIEVPHTDAIPSDYKGLMGVPITFLDKYCPEQFELVRFRKGDDGKDLMLEGKPPYFRILIRARDSRKGDDK